MVRRTALAALAYIVAACLFTWPLILHPRSLLGAMDPTGDPSLNLWTLGWDLHTLAAHPSWLLNLRVFDAPMYFPAPRTLAYSDHLLLQALLVAPIHAVTHDLVLCYNVLLLGSLVACALAMHVLVRQLIGRESPAFVGGLIFGFAPYHFTHLVHIQLQALYFLPLCFLFLHRLLRNVQWRDAIGLGIVAGLQTVSSVYYGVIGTIGLVCVAVMSVLLDRRWRAGMLLRRGAAAALVAIVIAAPWSISYLRVAAEAGGGRNLYETANSSATLASQFQAPPMNMIYGRTGLFRPGGGSRLPYRDGPEQALFLGFIPLALAAVGMATPGANLRRLATVYAILALVGVVLSLGPNGIRPVYALLYQGFFGMASIRAAARFDVLTLTAVAILASIGVQRLQARNGANQVVIAVVACALIAVEYCNGTIDYPRPPALTTNAGRWLKAQPGSSAVACIPMDLFETNTPCMLQGLEHGRPIVNGYSGLRPPYFEALADTANRLPAAESLLALHDLGVEFIVSNHQLPAGAEGALVERAVFDDQRVYQFAWSPELETRLRTSTEIAPPEPGPPPFAIGESATYHVSWTSGPVGLSAGDATIAVAPAQGSERYRFSVTAKTAPWMARFYDADVMLETTANERLLPLGHHETISEGRRRTDRQLTFDNDRHEVKVLSGGTSITLPLAKEARDPISALFYLRTLSIAPGDRVSLPLDDNGRRMRLELTADGLETITVGNRSWEALKVTPQLVDRIERRGALQIVAWLSADSRRIPLVVEVSASFGTARLELASYREK